MSGMGISGIGTSELVVILLIALLIFGTGRLRTLGGDLGAAIRSFRDAMGEERADHRRAQARAAAPSESGSPAIAPPEEKLPPGASGGT